MSDDLNQVRELYAHAERLLKEVERLTGEVTIPCINELRYAGFHILQAIDETGAVTKKDHVFRAKDHCERAIYDVAEAGLIFVIDTINRFLWEYRGIEIIDVVRNIPEIRARVEEASTLLEEGRSADLLDTDNILGLFRALKADTEDLDRHVPDLATKENKKRKDTRRFILGLVWAVVVAVVVALLIP